MNVISPKKLIEVALPLDAINIAAAREKSIRHGHPSTLHLWWARRPLAAARAVIFAQLVHDPEDLWRCQNPGVEPNQQVRGHWTKARAKLFAIIEDLVKWENTTNERVLKPAREAIRQSWRETCELNKNHPQAKELFNPDKMPGLHDPFAGGGAIPLEAQRLGLEAFASDLNPVAVLINKAMIEIPPKFAGKPPVHPDAKNALADWSGAAGLAEDVRRYGQWMRDEAFKRIGHLYPPIKITQEMADDRPDLEQYVGEELTVIAWLWTRTVKSPNPAFRDIDVPLASTFILSSKEGKEAYVHPVILGARPSRPHEDAGGTPSLPAEEVGARPSRPHEDAGGTPSLPAEEVGARPSQPHEDVGGTPALPAEEVGARPSQPHEDAGETPALPEEVEGARPSRPHEDAGGTPALPAYTFTVKVGNPPAEAKAGTKLSRGANFGCLMSKVAIEPTYIKAEAIAGRMGQRLMAIVAEGTRGRVYLSPTDEHEAIAKAADPKDAATMIHVPLADDPRNLWCLQYGLSHFDHLFTPRQLVALTTFSDLVSEAREQIYRDALGVRASRPPKFEHYRGYLPHWEAGERPQAITFRTADSLPKGVLEVWEQEIRLLPLDKQDAARRQRFADALDQGHGECLLRDAGLAAVVENALLHFHETRYRLHAWVIMPNHVHVLVTPLFDNSLSSILHSWKSFTAKEINKRLGRSGSLWQEEYFDRMIRDEEHFENTRKYIEENPVKAKLCRRAEDWPFSSAAGGAEKRAGRPHSQDELPLDAGGTGARAYAEAVSVYLGMAISKMADAQSSLCRWKTTMDQSIATFGRQALPMVWDYSEANVFGEMAGDPLVSLKNMMRVLDEMPASIPAQVTQTDAQSQSHTNAKFVSTDPPYYDNIGYADLSDYFYVWLRRSLRSVFPNLLATIAVPKAEELVATPYRHGTKQKAEKFFLDGMTQAMHNLAVQAHPAAPITIYYAFKQAETETTEGTSSSGWETFLDAVLKSGLAITGTWPMRTELGNRMVGKGTNALASSIILVCRPRAKDVGTIDRRKFQRLLNETLPLALDVMTGSADVSSALSPSGQDGRAPGHSPVAPVDLSQAIIGPGMAIFSRYDAVLEANGDPMTVKTALQLINRFLAEDDFDADTQFCLHWFEQHGWEASKFGEADTLARAKGTSVEGVRQAGVIQSGGGNVRLLKWKELDAAWDPAKDPRIPVWQVLHQMILSYHTDGDSGAGRIYGHPKTASKTEAARQLAYRLYTLCERKGWAEDARAFNEVVTGWSGIESAAAKVSAAVQRGLFDDEPSPGV